MRIVPLVFSLLALPLSGGAAAEVGLPAPPPRAAPRGAQPLPITAALIEQLVREAGTNNPALLAAAERVQAARQQTAGVRSWEDPMFTLGYAVTSSRGFKSSEEGDLAYGLNRSCRCGASRVLRARWPRRKSQSPVRMRISNAARFAA